MTVKKLAFENTNTIRKPVLRFFGNRKVVSLIIFRFGEILAPCIHRDWIYLILKREKQLNMSSPNKEIKAQRRRAEGTFGSFFGHDFIAHQIKQCLEKK